MAALPGIRGQVYKDRFYDASGTITTGGTAQLLLPVSQIRSSLVIVNNSSDNLLLEFGAGRATATLTSGAVSSCSVTNAGFGYSIAPAIKFLGGAFGPPGNPQIAPTYTLQGLPDWTCPNKPATAHCVMTGSAPNMTISSIVIDNPGTGYAYPPYVQIVNYHNDPFGCAVPSATVGLPLFPGGSYDSNGSICITDQISIYGSTTGQQYLCKYTL